MVFDDPKLQKSTARQEFVCRWTFPTSVGEEAGWEIAHFFRSDEEAHYHVQIVDRAGRPLPNANPIKIDPASESKLLKADSCVSPTRARQRSCAPVSRWELRSSASLPARASSS
jgi:hypothetical protein